MKIRGDIESVNLSTGERFERVVGDGESRLVPVPNRGMVDVVRLGPRRDYVFEHSGPTPEEIVRRAQEILDLITKAKTMHYRNGREAKNGDRVVSLAGYGSGPVNINAIGILFDAKPGNDHCNGSIASILGGPVVGACLCDCLHYDDVAEMIVEKGLDKRPAGK